MHALESGLGLPNGVADTWPLRDSALKPLHDHEPSKARFAELLKTYNGVPEKDPDPLAELRGVGSYHASQLKKHGYGTPESLRALANDYARQTRLAKDLSVSHSLVLRWLRLALMYHVAGQASGVVNLLELAGVETLYELARQKADELAKRLGDLNQDPKLVETAPTAASIQPWIDAAKAAAR